MKARRHLFTTLAVLVLLPVQVTPETSPTPDGEAVTRIPPVLFAHLLDWPLEYPVWVSAEAAITENGEINRDLVPDAFAGSLYQLLNDPQLRSEGCIRLEEVWRERINPPDRSTMAKAVATADVILRGTVVEKDYGFQAVTAGQLIRIRVEEVVKGEKGLAEYLAFIPVGRFTAGPYKICKTDRRYAGAPKIRDQVLLMPEAVTDIAETYLHLTEPESLILLTKDSGPKLPQSLKDSIPPSRTVKAEQLLQHIRGLVQPTAGKE